jgi:hypothetical protein
MSAKATLITLLAVGLLAGGIGTVYGSSKKAQEYADNLVDTIANQSTEISAELTYLPADFTKTKDDANPKGKFTVRLFRGAKEDTSTPFWVNPMLVTDSALIHVPVITASADHVINGNGDLYGYSSGVSFDLDFSASTLKVEEWLGYMDVVTTVRYDGYLHRVGERYIPFLQAREAATSTATSSAS